MQKYPPGQMNISRNNSQNQKVGSNMDSPGGLRQIDEIIGKRKEENKVYSYTHDKFYSGQNSGTQGSVERKKTTTFARDLKNSIDLQKVRADDGSACE